MARNEDSFSVPSMVPDRDDVVRRGARRGATSSKPPRDDVARHRAPPGTSGGIKFLLFVLVLGLFGTGAAGYFFYMESQAMKQELASADMRLQSLENRLSAVGENSEETTLKITEQMTTNMSEIAKLWDARKKMLTDIDVNEDGVAALKTTTEELEAAMETQAGRLNTAANQLASMQTRIDTITGNIANLDRFSQQLTTLSQDVSQIETNVNSLSDLAGRVGTSEQDIESINVFRLQVNQSLNAMQSQIQDLQRRLATP